MNESELENILNTISKKHIVIRSSVVNQTFKKIHCREYIGSNVIVIYVLNFVMFILPMLEIIIFKQLSLSIYTINLTLSLILNLLFIYAFFNHNRYDRFINLTIENRT